MGRFRKKPVIIDAFRWTGYEEQTEDPEWIVVAIGMGTARIEYPYMFIRTLEGEMRANPGDWIICGINKEIYPCKPDIFEATYEVA